MTKFENVMLAITYLEQDLNNWQSWNTSNCENWEAMQDQLELIKQFILEHNKEYNYETTN
jgi:hypothetical protein